MHRTLLTLIAIIICHLHLSAQNMPIGSWKTHLPYKNARSVALSKNYLYTASGSAVFSYHLNDGSMKIYSKSEGLSDVGIASIAYDTSTSSLIIAYANSNIDLLRDGKVKNLPFLMKANIIGNKEVNKIYTFEGTAWLATGFGLVEIRLDKQEIGDTYYFSDGASNYKVNDVWANEDHIYAATEQGLFRGSRDANTNLVNFQNWRQFQASDGLSTDHFPAVTGRGHEVFTANGSTIYKLEDDYWTPYYNMPSPDILSLFKGKKRLLISQKNTLAFVPDMGSPENVTGKYYIAMPLQIIEADDGRIFYADLHRSAIEYINSSKQISIYPNGPDRNTCKGIDFLGNKTFIGSSPINTSFHPTFNASGFYVEEDYIWRTYTEGQLPDMQGAYDISVVQAIPAEDIVLFGAHNTGLVEYNHKTESVKFIKNFPNATSNMRITAATLDKFGNVWLSNAYSTQPLICRKPGGEYILFSSPLINDRLINGITIDHSQQVWMTIANRGIVVFNYGESIDDKSDDRFITYNTTPGNGGLTTNSVTSITTDLKGEVWIGTIEGAMNVPCPSAVFDNNCDAQQICVPRNDGTNFCDPLLETETIYSIAVDAANRKWFGTSNGIFLKSEDGYENIHYFSEDNSPLLSNRITTLGVHPNTGDLFVLTEKGIISYRSDATHLPNDHGQPYAYPNPVRPNYTGPVAIKNLPENSLVKITDTAGRLVAEGTSNGSQFIWDGKDLNGKRVQTGIYYVLASSSDKKQKASTKIAFIH